MGLYICKKLAKKLEGSIKIYSHFNEGCQILFSFKPYQIANYDKSNKIEEDHKSEKCGENVIKSDSDNEEILPSSARFGPNKEKSNSSLDRINDIQVSLCHCPKILIVDDEISNRNVISHYCKRLNLHSEEAINGLEALEKVENFFTKFHCCPNYELILMDSNMPVMNGEESSLKIRSFWENHVEKMPKIICVTANAINQRDDISHKKIYDDLYYKPLRFETFKLILAQQNLLCK